TEIGSILRLEKVDKDLILEFVNDCPPEGQFVMGEVNIEKTQEQLRNIVQVAVLLTQKYDVMVTNPPYLNKFAPKLKKYIWDNYKDYKRDMFSVFIYHNIELCKPNGYSAYMSPFVWMFIKTYEDLRKHIIKTKHISSLIQMEYSAFEEATVPICTFVLQNMRSEEKGNYIKLSDFRGGMEVQRVKTLEALQDSKCGYYYESNQDNFEKLPGSPVAYWASKNIIEAFEKGKQMNSIIEPRQGLATTDNNKFIRLWYEVDHIKITFNVTSTDDSVKKKVKWVPYNKGGAKRQWYGNYDYVVDWSNNGEIIKENVLKKYPYLKTPDFVVKNTDYYFKEAITWGLITTAGFSIRYRKPGSIHDVSGMSAFSKNYDILIYILGLMSTPIADYIFKMLNPTINLQVGDFNNFPVIVSNNKNTVIELAQKNISISEKDWDSFETSWDFLTHPLLDISKQEKIPCTIEQSYSNCKNYYNTSFNKLKSNEEELNRIFIEIYGLEDELTPEVSDKDITITKVFDTKDEIYDDIKGNQYILTKEDVMKSLISYAVGCMFGRYSLDVEGLAYAGGEWDDSKYSTFKPSKDNIILISDEEYFEDDIVNRFVDFVRTTYGKDTLEENLKFIA
ncbi:MAG: BREX-1 system adenine-specific DNA-methyltransferase PglX, partial [Clostridiales bacterium]|nr:BREX-1 system adenine-specific DNA-methyltransferase PglX [Clostridiales bacterium]